MVDKSSETNSSYGFMGSGSDDVIPFEGDLTEEEEILWDGVTEAVQELRASTSGVASLSHVNPERAANALFWWSRGWSQTKLRKRMGLDPDTLRHLLVDYADHLGKWKELGGKIAARSYVRMSGLEDELMDKLEEHLESGRYRPSFDDLKSLAIGWAGNICEGATGGIVDRHHSRRQANSSFDSQTDYYQ